MVILVNSHFLLTWHLFADMALLADHELRVAQHLRGLGQLPALDTVNDKARGALWYPTVMWTTFC